VLREYLRDGLDIRPLIKHCINKPYEHAHNARIEDDLYHQCFISESVFSSIKRSLGVTLRARVWYREFCEIALMLQYTTSRKPQSRRFYYLQAIKHRPFGRSS